MLVGVLLVEAQAVVSDVGKEVVMLVGVKW